MKFIFAGTTEFGIPTLEKLISSGHELLFVITQPDKPTGRKQELTAPPIKVWAQKNNIRILQPNKITEIYDEIGLPKPDILLVAAYGQIIPDNILILPKFGSINIHGSILPKYRGASPIQAALLNGDKTTGITLIKMDAKMDHGPIIGTKETPIESENFDELYKKLSLLSADFTPSILEKYINGEIKPLEQNHTQATFTKLLSKNDSKIDWTSPAEKTLNQIRALNPKPGTFTTLDGKNIKILKARLLSEIKIELAGKLYRSNSELAVKTADKSLIIEQIQPDGGRVMPGSDFLNGIKNLDSKFFV